MQNTELTKKIIKQEIVTTEALVNDLLGKIGSWGGGSLAVLDKLSQKFDSQWPKLEFLRILLVRENISDEDLELVHQVSMTETELVFAKKRLAGSLSVSSARPIKEEIIFAQVT